MAIKHTHVEIENLDYELKKLKKEYFVLYAKFYARYVKRRRLEQIKNSKLLRWIRMLSNEKTKTRINSFIHYCEAGKKPILLTPDEMQRFRHLLKLRFHKFDKLFSLAEKWAQSQEGPDRMKENHQGIDTGTEKSV